MKNNSKKIIKLESKIQSKILYILNRNGFFTVKIMAANKNGIPDIIALKNGLYYWIEVKRENENPDDVQTYKHELIKKNGGNVLVIKDISELNIIL